MTSPPGSTLKEFRAGPLFFFDQPGRDRTKGTRTSILHFNLANAGPRLGHTITSNLAQESKSEEHNVQTMPSDGSDKHDPTPSTAKRNPEIKTSEGMDDSSVDIYKHAAPELLKELACLLAKHRWTEERCIPQGFVNILNCSWRDLTSGASHVKRGEGGKSQKSKGSMNFDETLQRLNANYDKRKTENGNPIVVGNVGCPERKAKANPNVLTKRSGALSNGQRAHASTTISFSMSSNICKEQGWIIQPSKGLFLYKPQQTCRWVIDRLQKATVPIKLQAAEKAEQGLNKPVILRYYGDDKPYLKKRAGTKAHPVTLVNGMPRIPEVKGEVPLSQKLHYRIDDGSSLIYYPSGRVAVCQSHSALPCGGFYTNVFCDSDCPITLASITAFGHGTITHPISGTITAVWDQSGGLMFDPDGTVTKEWTWQTRAKLKTTVLQVSEFISIGLFSSTSAMISFRTYNECVKLFLSALSNVTPPKEMPGLQTVGNFTSSAAQELMQAKKRKKTATESQSVLALKPVCARSQEVLQMDKEMEGLEEQPPLMWRGRARNGSELTRLQRRVRNTLEDWLEHYRVATGIKCPDIEQMPDAPLRTRLRREVQSAALPSLTPLEQAVTQQGHPVEGRVELQQAPPRHLSAPADYLLRTPKKRVKEESHVTQIGSFRVRSNIKLDSVFVLRTPELQPSSAAIPSLPVQPPLPPCPCPALLRAALLGDKMQRWLCCCSCRSMPAVTDVEYDVFINRQPPRSEQIIVVVCVSPQPLETHALSGQLDALERLHERMNKSRSTPCTQCQMDSFRLVRYEVFTGKARPGVQHNALLQHRHNAGPGMVLMYIRGKLLFADYIFNGYCCSATNLQKQISRTRGDYRLGQSLPSDYKFSVKINGPGARKWHHSGDPSTTTPSEVGGPEGTTPLLEKERTQTSSRGNSVSVSPSCSNGHDECL